MDTLSFNLNDSNYNHPPSPAHTRCVRGLQLPSDTVPVSFGNAFSVLVADGASPLPQAPPHTKSLNTAHVMLKLKLRDTNPC